jgi:hypothetical protein
VGHAAIVATPAGRRPRPSRIGTNGSPLTAG